MKAISRTGVYGVVINEGKILLVQQQSGPHIGKFDLPGGGLELGESVEEALRREFREETGLGFSKMSHIGNFTAMTESIDLAGQPYLFYQIGLIYRVEDLTVIPNSTPEMELHWIACNQLFHLPIAPFVNLINSHYLLSIYNNQISTI